MSAPPFALARGEYWMYVQGPMSAISPPIQAVLELFEGPLSELRFGDIDAPTLRRLASEVSTSAAELASQEAALDALRQALAARQEQLLGQAQRALAYARVYAENDEELSARLAAIQLPRPAKRQRAEASKAGAKIEPAEKTLPSASVISEPVEASAGAESAEEPAPPARRGKRREATRSVTRDEALENSP